MRTQRSRWLACVWTCVISSSTAGEYSVLGFAAQVADDEGQLLPTPSSVQSVLAKVSRGMTSRPRCHGRMVLYDREHVRDACPPQRSGSGDTPDIWSRLLMHAQRHLTYVQSWCQLLYQGAPPVRQPRRPAEGATRRVRAGPRAAARCPGVRAHLAAVSSAPDAFSSTDHASTSR